MEPTSDTPAAGPSGLERMRLLVAENPDLMYSAFDTYPWAKDPKFQALLAAELLNQTELSPAEIGLQCRIKRYNERVGIQIDVDAYNTYRSSGIRSPLNLVPQVILDQEALYEPDVSKRKYAALVIDATGEQDLEQDQHVPSWQRSAPKAPLYIDKSKDAGTTGGQGKEPYPKKFEEIIAFLQTGKEIPGIVKIPDTVIDDPSISTTSGLTAPLKPWERRAVANDKT
ncbi:hypothetical protein BX600DRAFT_140272 [Xylariales sp. PMI_506]|nr:hypothetical protein BX600DRAFT_140272 [Xylariales sp. PMI_506]